MLPKPITFPEDAGLLLDRALTVFVNDGSSAAMTALIPMVREDVRENASNRSYTPKPLLWYLVGARISGDASFHTSPEFLAKLALDASELEMFKMHVSAIELFRERAAAACAP